MSNQRLRWTARKSGVYTDDFSVFIETEDGEVIEHADCASIDGEGNTSMGIFYLSHKEFEKIKIASEAEGGMELIVLRKFD